MNMRNSRIRLCFLLIAVCLQISACASVNYNEVIPGTWRATVETSGGKLPFIIEIEQNEAMELTAHVINGEERVEASEVLVEKDSVTLSFSMYGSYIKAKLSEQGTKLNGSFKKRVMYDRTSEISFEAEKSVTHRFNPIEPSESVKTDITDISGEWSVKFGSGKENSIAMFMQNGKTVTGTFMTPTGDYRYLEGVYEEGNLRLSCFDGSHSFLFHAKVTEDNTLDGMFYYAKNRPRSWTASKKQITMPDPYGAVVIPDLSEKFQFAFPDLEGKIIDHDDERFRGKPLLAIVYGSWCPNSNDAASYLVQLYEKYQAQGLEIVGLLNEFTDDLDTAKERITVFSEKHGMKWPQLFMGKVNKREAAEKLKNIDNFRAYPTVIFIDRNGRIKKIRSGFAGPATGEYYEQLKREFEEIIREII